MGRRRKRENQFLEPNLYPNGRYFQYVHPATKQKRSLGRDLKRAREIARLLNARLMTEDHSTLVDYVASAAPRSNRKVADLLVADLVKSYRENRVPDLDWGEQTAKNEGWNLDRIVRDLGSIRLMAVTTVDLSTWLGQAVSRSAYTKLRTRLIDLFRYGVSCGYLEKNPAEATLPRGWRSKDKKRSRLRLEDYTLIHAAAEPWLRTAMEIGLITLQRAGDIVGMRYDQIRTNSDAGVERLYLAQNKTHKTSDAAFLAIAIGPSLRKTIDASQDSIPSPYIVHRKPDRRRGKRDEWTAVSRDYLTKRFSALRDELGIASDLPADERPTFHEIRGLGIHLYERRLGRDESFTQQLAGHSKRKMTDEYAKGHEVTYNEVDADMDFDLLVGTNPQSEL